MNVTRQFAADRFRLVSILRIDHSEYRFKKFKLYYPEHRYVSFNEVMSKILSTII